MRMCLFHFPPGPNLNPETITPWDSPNDKEELQEISNNGFEMVSSLLSVFPH